MKTAHLVPKCKLVLIPESRQPLPKEGAVMPLNKYWKRRLMFGEVEIKAEKKVVEKKEEVKKDFFDKNYKGGR